MVIHDAEDRDGCCAHCGALFHTTDTHEGASDDLPAGYDPTEADRLIGRTA